MDENLRNVFVNKLEEIRDQEPYCAVQWADTKRIEMIEQKYIRLKPSYSPEINGTYTIFIEDVRRHATVLAKGTRTDCEFFLGNLRRRGSQSQSADSFNSVEKSSSSSKNGSDLVDNFLLMRILGKIINNSKSNSDNNGEDIHHTQCASCRMEPIRYVDRFHCLECFNYDLCGRCFEQHRTTDKHSSGHAMVHFRLPNEFLGIHVNNIEHDVTLNKLKQLHTLKHEQHDGIICDGNCRQKPIVGLRFKCDTCPNYNLCEICAIEKRVCTKMHQRDHPLILTSDKILPKIDSTDIELGDVLGRGGFGYVCKAVWRSKNRQVACKVIEVSGSSAMSNELRRSFLLELAAYRELSGSYILRTFAYATCDLPANRIRGATTQFMILMELMGRGSLQTLLENNSNHLSLRRKLSMSRQIASGMRRIHQHGMIHRDIRPDNILITDDYVAKIGDMGIARVLDLTGQQTQIGCEPFMPPEFFQESSDGHVQCDEKLDIYTFGLTLNQLYTEAMHEFRRGSSTPHIILTKQSPIFYDEIILKCLDKHPKRRPTALEIEKTLELYEHAFIETMLSDAYTRMNTGEKDQVFIEFYQKNRSQIQHFVKEQFPQRLFQENPVEFKQKQLRTFNEEPVKDPCRIS